MLVGADPGKVPGPGARRSGPDPGKVLGLGEMGQLLDS